MSRRPASSTRRSPPRSRPSASRPWPRPPRTATPPRWSSPRPCGRRSSRTPVAPPTPAWVRWGLLGPVVACGLLALAVWFSPSRSLSHISRPAASPLQAGIAVKHYKELGDGRRVVPHGTISETSLASDLPRLKDLVRVQVAFSRPAYSYLIALNPNGTIQLCVPVGGIVPSLPRRELDFPEYPADYFGLTDGVGLQAFVVVASDRPLPAYESWKTQVPAAWPGLRWIARASGPTTVPPLPMPRGSAASFAVISSGASRLPRPWSTSATACAGPPA
jgi:hypothetical protein